MKTTPFRRILTYIVEHGECTNEMGISEKITSTTDKKFELIELYPPDQAVIHYVAEGGYTRRITCKIKD